MLKFTKMSGAGNDFVLVDNRDGAVRLERGQIARICDRHRGVGADGVLLVEGARNGADYRMRYYNADGGEVEMCANGARCFARFAGRLGGMEGPVSFETEAGVIRAEGAEGGQVRIAMSQPHGLVVGERLEVGSRELEVHSVNTGVPHAVLFVEDVEAVDVRGLGAALRWHARFAPKGTNANFAQVLDYGRLRVRTYERGVEDETLACGTGIVACALMLNAVRGTPGPVEVQARGGDWLRVEFAGEPGAWSGVALTGPADFVFDGEIGV